MTESGVEIRTAEPADLDRLTALLTQAFKDDPLWRWAFHEEEGMATWWRFLIRSALRYPCTWIAGDFAAAAVWIPPGGTELTHDEEQRVEPLLRELVGPRAPQVTELLARYEAAHPRDPPHYYLSLLDARRRADRRHDVARPDACGHRVELTAHIAVNSKPTSAPAAHPLADAVGDRG